MASFITHRKIWWMTCAVKAPLPSMDTCSSFIWNPNFTSSFWALRHINTNHWYLSFYSFEIKNTNSLFYLNNAKNKYLLNTFTDILYLKAISQNSRCCLCNLVKSHWNVVAAAACYRLNTLHVLYILSAVSGYQSLCFHSGQDHTHQSLLDAPHVWKAPSVPPSADLGGLSSVPAAVYRQRESQ